MQTCQRCGATLDPSATACPYCSMQTPYGYHVAQQQTAYAQHAAYAAEQQKHAERARAAEPLKKTSLQALLAAVLGSVFCCAPAAILGIVLGLRAKSVARQHGLVAPASSTAAVVVGACGTVLFCVLLVLFVRDNQKHDARVDELQAVIDRSAQAQTLDQRTACILAEHRLLKDGYRETTGLSIYDFECSGKLEQAGERATLHDVRFRPNTDPRVTVAVCLSRGARWSVSELREDNDCGPKPSAPATSSSTR